MDKRIINTAGYAAAVMAAMAGLWLSSRYSYLLFHSLAELFSIAVAAAMFAVAWNSRRFSTNGYLTYVGIAFLSVAGLDLVHTLAYKGLGVFAGYGADLPTQLWIAARGVESLSLLISPIFLVRRVRPWPTLLTYLAVTGALLVVIFPLNAFPTCYVEGGLHPGLTPFKIVAEYVICGVLLASMGGLWTGRRRLSPNALALMIAAIGTTVLSELAFTRYISVYGDFNMAGHLLKVGSFLLIYKATVEATLKHPYEVLFRDLKQHEKTLQESQQRWATTLGSIGDAVIATDVEGKIAFMNAVAEEMTGWRLEEASVKPVTEIFNIINEQTRGEVENPVTKVLREGIIVGVANHTLLVRKDGTELPIDDSGAPIKDKDGNTVGVVLVFRDVSERRQIDEALRKERDFVSAVLDTAGALVIVLDSQGRITRFNRACEEITGYSATEVLGRVLWEFLVPPEELPGVRETWEALKAGDFPNTHENHWLARDRSRRLIAWSNTALTGEAGDLQYIIGTGVDITDHRQAEEALLRAKESWERTFASVPDLIAILDNQHQVLRVNEAMARRLGVKAEEAIGLRCYEVVHGLSEPPDFCPHSWTIKDSRQHIEEVHEDRLGGDFVVSTSPLHDDKGQMIGTVHVAHDITKRKKAEDALQKAHNELEIRVEERTAELTRAYEKLEIEMAERARVEEQLRQSHKMEAVGTLAGGIAHDFNNMLAAIIGNAELAMDDVPEEMTARHNLDQIFKAGMRARGLVRQILTFSRKTEHEHKPLPLTPLVNETFKLLRSSLPTIIEMRLNIETVSDVVLADPVQMQQVLMNLCTNAGDAMRAAGGRLELSLSPIRFSGGRPSTGDRYAAGHLRYPHGERHGTGHG